MGGLSGAAKIVGVVRRRRTVVGVVGVANAHCENLEEKSMAAHRATMRGRAVPFRAVVPPMSPVFTRDFSSVVPTISAMRGQHVCRRRMLSSGQRHLLPAELARPVMPSSSPARAPGIATACLLQCVVNSHCLWLLSCVVDACVVSCAWNCTLACVSCMVLGGSVYSHVNVSVNVAGSVARVSLKLYYSHVYSTASRKDRPQEAAWPPTHHVRRHHSPT